jgi:hypothetical protein
VAFLSSADNLVPGDTNAVRDIFRKDLETGDIVRCSTSASGGEANGFCFFSPSISANGTHVAFTSKADNLVSGDTNNSWDVFRKDLATGDVTRCSSSVSGVEGNSNSGIGISSMPKGICHEWIGISISSDGRYVSFSSEADNLVPGDTNERRDVFRKDLATGDIVRCSTSSFGEEVDSNSWFPSTNANGGYIAFLSYSSNLVQGDTNECEDVFRKDLNVGEPGPSPTPGTVSTFYFAEGYTGEGFTEYLCMGNPGDEEANATITYMFTDGSTQQQTVTIPPRSRSTVNVNASVEAGREVSARVEADQDIVAERPMYFTYEGAISGGHDTVGATSLSREWYFSEGYTGQGFSEWICVLNPGDEAANLTFSFQTEEAGLVEKGGLAVPPHSRGSFKVNDVLGPGYQTSLKLSSDQEVVAESPIYFDYTGTGNWHWQGGHCVMGTPALSHEYYFAEGTTRSGFEEWLTIQNPTQEAITVSCSYQLGEGEPVATSHTIEGGQRKTLFVPQEVGQEKDVSVHLSSESDFLAERPLYFAYTYPGLACQGGHCVIGATSPANNWFLAEGYTGSGFNQWLCLQNPGASEATVTITYLTQEAGALAPMSISLPPGSRRTVMVNDSAGPGYQLSCSLASSQPIVVERPMYFVCAGCPGGHDVVGFTP